MITSFTPTPDPVYEELTFPKPMIHPTNGSIILALSDGTGVVLNANGVNLPERINNVNGYEDAIGQVIMNNQLVEIPA